MSEPDFPEPTAQAAAAADDAIDTARRDAVLRDAGLIRERRPVYIADETAPPKKGSAQRMARLRERRRAAGLTPVEVPAEVLARVQQLGGWQQVQRALEQPTAPPAPAPVAIPAPAPAPAAARLSDSQAQALRLGLAVQRTRGWRRLAVRALLGV